MNPSRGSLCLNHFHFLERNIHGRQNIDGTKKKKEIIIHITYTTIRHRNKELTARNKT